MRTIGIDNIDDILGEGHSIEERVEYANKVENIRQRAKSVPTVDEYLEAQRDINERLDKGIQPVDHIKDGCDASWIAPDGSYYGLNGEIAHMLHNQLADALYEAGIIPEGEENESNPDVWLEKNGWVKQHGDWILFGAATYPECKDTHMTEEQLKVIHEYIGYHQNGVAKCGFRMERMSTTRLQMYDKFALRKLFGLD
jgi:hypothetical protein